MTEHRDYYTYVYFHPETFEPIYIGAGRGRRWKGHLLNSSNPQLEQLLAEHDRKIPHEKLLTGLSRDEAHFNETSLIAAIGRQCDGGPLFNLAAGGISSSAEHPDVRAKMSAAWNDRVISLETRAEMSAAKIGTKHSPERRANIGEGCRKIDRAKVIELKAQGVNPRKSRRS
jgi:hypothetical protein